MTDRDLRERLRALGLTATADSFDDLIAAATKKRSSAVELFERVATLEEKDRSRRGLERRLKRTRLDRFKPMADYDWNWPTKIDRPPDSITYTGTGNVDGDREIKFEYSDARPDKLLWNDFR